MRNLRFSAVIGLGFLCFVTLQADTAHATPADSIYTGVCEGSILPIGVILPTDGFQAGCSHRYVLKYGTGGGDRGRYGLIDLPPCPSGPCGNPGGHDRLSCELRYGNYCCTETIIGTDVNPLPGSKTGPFLKALSDRFWADTDHQVECYVEYTGNGERLLRVLALVSDGNGGKSYRVAGIAHFFMRERPDQGSDDLVGEFVPVTPH